MNFFDASKNGDYGRVKQLLDYGEDVNQVPVKTFISLKLTVNSLIYFSIIFNII